MSEITDQMNQVRTVARQLTSGGWWWVIVECKEQIILLNRKCDGFWIHGQEVEWRLDHVQKWIAPVIRHNALLAEAEHSKMTPEKAMQLAEDFCKREAWGLDFWREPMAVLAAELARLQSANVELCQPCPPSTPPRQETAAGQGLA